MAGPNPQHWTSRQHWVLVWLALQEQHGKTIPEQRTVGLDRTCGQDRPGHLPAIMALVCRLRMFCPPPPPRATVYNQVQILVQILTQALIQTKTAHHDMVTPVLIGLHVIWDQPQGGGSPFSNPPPPLPSSAWTRRREVKQGKSGGSVGTTDQGKGKGRSVVRLMGTAAYRGKGQGKGKGRGEGRLGQGGRGRSKGGEKPMGTTAYGGKGSKGRAANGDRPVGAASCRRDHHTMASCQTPPPPVSPPPSPPW